MVEKIAFAAWDMISILCGNHKELLVLKEKRGQAVYCCPCENCHVCLPAIVHEKILEETVRQMNTGKLVIGEHWKRQYLGKPYDCTVLNRPEGKQIEVAVTPLFYRGV